MPIRAGIGTLAVQLLMTRPPWSIHNPLRVPQRLGYSLYQQLVAFSHRHLLGGGPVDLPGPRLRHHGPTCPNYVVHQRFGHCYLTDGWGTRPEHSLLITTMPFPS